MNRGAGAPLAVLGSVAIVRLYPRLGRARPSACRFRRSSFMVTLGSLDEVYERFVIVKDVSGDNLGSNYCFVNKQVIFRNSELFDSRPGDKAFGYGVHMLYSFWRNRKALGLQKACVIALL